MMESVSSQFEKKVFFLYPHNVIRDILIKEIVKKEYEAYPLNNHSIVFQMFKVFSNPIIFVNIDDRRKLPDWEQYIMAVQNEPESRKAMIGALTSGIINNNLDESFLNSNLPCGLITLSNNLDECINIIVKTLEVNGAKGRRKYIRAKCHDKNNAGFSIKIDSSIHQGRIYDLSSAGMACSFDDNICLEAGTYIHDLQLSLKGYICGISGKIQGFQNNGEDIYVIMFDYRKTYSYRDKILSYIYYLIQNEMKQKIEIIGKN